MLVLCFAQTYDLAREMGKSERSQSATPSPSAGLRPASASAAQRGPSASYASASAVASPGPGHATASHSLLEAILSGSPVGAAAAAAAASPGFSMAGAASERRRPQSALAPRTSSYASPSARSPGMVGGAEDGPPGPGAGASRQQKAAQLQAEAEALRHQLDEARAQVEAQGEVETQLRDTIDLLRARLHGQVGVLGGKGRGEVGGRVRALVKGMVSGQEKGDTTEQRRRDKQWPGMFMNNSGNVQVAGWRGKGGYKDSVVVQRRSKQALVMVKLDKGRQVT